MRSSPDHSFARALTLHLIRGVLGFSAIAGAFWVLGAHWAASAAVAVALVVAALVALRGCPTCWLTGLLGIVSEGGRSCPVPRKNGAGPLSRP